MPALAFHHRGAGNCSLALQFQINVLIIHRIYGELRRHGGHFTFLRHDQEYLYSGKSGCGMVMYTFYLAGTLVEELDYAF